MNRIVVYTTLALVGTVALVAVGAAGGAASKGKPKLSATPVFKLHMKPSQEVPRIQGLKADAVGSVTFDLTRSTPGGAITAGEVVFYVNYAFPASVQIVGLHVHQGAKGANGPVVITSGVAPFVDADGVGNVTTVVPGSPATLQAILDNPRGYYVNLHTATNPDGALRTQLRNPTKR